MMKNIWTYFFLLLILIFGIISFEYAFPNLSTQQSAAAVISIYCFSFFTTMCIILGTDIIKENKDE